MDSFANKADEDAGRIMSENRWSGSDLLAELRRFEGELCEAGLRDHTVETYVGRCETFIRWLMGEYTPHRPGRVPDEADQGARPSLGIAILDDFRANLSEEEIASYLADYATETSYDVSFRLLTRSTGNQLDLRRETHRVAAINWLRAWGCRHLRRTDTYRTAEALRLWWDEWGEALPGPEAALTDLTDPGLVIIEQAYDALRSAPAAGRNRKGREIDVHFGDTAAAKVMFAARPTVFLPWDDPIRLAFGWRGGGATYVELLRLSASALDGLARRLAVSVSDLPQILHRPDSSPPKLVDEFLWVRITKGL
jgi:hypothetical protein